MLATPKTGSSWTTRWLEVKKKHADNLLATEAKKPHQEEEKMPVFGYADPRSYAIMEGAVAKLKTNGAVRHGPECFNYNFPQVSNQPGFVIPMSYPAAHNMCDFVHRN